MKFATQTASDIRKYFLGSFVKFPMAGETVHYVDKVDGSALRGRAFVQQEDGSFEEEPFVFHLQSLSEDSPQVEFILPRKSYFNYENSAQLLYRIPARQYHRGVTGENTSIVRLVSGIFDTQPLDFARLTAYVGKQAFMPFGVHEGWVSYAVSRRCAVSNDNNIYIDKARVGSINYDKKEIIVFNELFKDEVSKLLNEQNSEFKLVAAAEKRAARKSPVKRAIKENEIEF